MDSCGAESGSGPPPFAKSTPTMFRCPGVVTVEPLAFGLKIFPEAEERVPVGDMTEDDVEVDVCPPVPAGDCDAKYEVGALPLNKGVIGLMG